MMPGPRPGADSHLDRQAIMRLMQDRRPRTSNDIVLATGIPAERCGHMIRLLVMSRDLRTTYAKGSTSLRIYELWSVGEPLMDL